MAKAGRFKENIMGLGDLSGLLAGAMPRFEQYQKYQKNFNDQKAAFNNSGTGILWKALQSSGIAQSSDGLGGAVSQLTPIGYKDGKVIYSVPSDKVFTGNADRVSYVYQGWNDPKWISDMAKAGKITKTKTTGPRGETIEAYAVDPTIAADPKFSVKQDSAYRGANTGRGTLGLGEGFEKFAAIGAGLLTGAAALGVNGANLTSFVADPLGSIGNFVDDKISSIKDIFSGGAPAEQAGAPVIEKSKDFVGFQGNPDTLGDLAYIGKEYAGGLLGNAATFLGSLYAGGAATDSGGGGGEIGGGGGEIGGGGGEIGGGSTSPPVKEVTQAAQRGSVEAPRFRTSRYPGFKSQSLSTTGNTSPISSIKA